MRRRHLLGMAVTAAAATIAATVTSCDAGSPTATTPDETRTAATPVRSSITPETVAAAIPGTLYYNGGGDVNPAVYRIAGEGMPREVAKLPDSRTSRISPDGRRVAWTDGASGALVLANVDGSSKQVVDATGSAWNMDWSPDSARLVYRHRMPDGAQTIKVADANGTGTRAIGGDGDFPTWSPDGAWIVYASGRDRQLWTAVTRVRPDGMQSQTVQARLGERGRVAQIASVSPGATQVLVSTFCAGCDGDNLYRRFDVDTVIDTANGASQKLTSTQGNVAFALWTSDAKMLVRIQTGQPTQNTLGTYALELRAADGTALARQAESDELRQLFPHLVGYAP